MTTTPQAPSSADASDGRTVEIRNRWTGAVIRTAPATPDGRADLSDADLSDAVLRGADLSDAVLRGADLSGADLSDAVLSGAVLSDAVLRGADLSGAVLSDAVLRGADLSDAVLRGAVLSDAEVHHGIPVVPNIHAAVYEAASRPGALNMGAWHTCETTHCRAGWVVQLAGAAGATLEGQIGTAAAAALIYYASDTALERVPDWYASNAGALADMQRLAGAGAAGAEATTGGV